MLLVISPAKNLDYDSPLPAIKASQPLMLDEAQRLVDELKTYSPHQISALMGISDKLGTLNYDRYQAWQRPFTPKNARPAVFTFNGDVYQGLQAHQLDAHALAFAQSHLRILSGLYGVLRPLDLMQPYRLEMGTKLTNARGTDLYSFWREGITDHLNALIKKQRAQALINLASNEYFKAIDKKALSAPVIEPVFKDWKNGQYKVISFFAKKARGMMSAYIVRKQLTDPEALKSFDDGGYHYHEAMSTNQRWVFTRKTP